MTLPNAANAYAQALDSLTCRRRVLLSGTPIQARLARALVRYRRRLTSLRLQNHLDEFYAMVNFANPVRADECPLDATRS